MNIFLSIFLFLLLAISVFAQYPPVGTIDFYGLKTVSEAQIRRKLQIKEGDPIFQSKDEQTEIEKRLASLPNVAEAKINLACCTNDGKTLLYVGIRERGTPVLAFRAAPTGAVRLTDEIVKAGKDFSEVHERAILKGDAAEDRSAGHSLMKNAEGRAVQETFIPLAKQNLNLLRRVLRQSGDAEHRALAAQVIPYYQDKSVIVADLLYALKDSSSTVRNNAMRALGLIAGYAFANPEKQIKVPFAPFVDLLNSIEWSDRNKSALAIWELTDKRNPALLELLRQKAILSLMEMARWKNRGHADMSFIILGRVAGFSEDEIGQALMTGKQEELILRAKKILQKKS